MRACDNQSCGFEATKRDTLIDYPRVAMPVNNALDN
jgi:hypothetical protein